MKKDMIAVAASLCSANTVEEVHEWVRTFNQELQQEVDPVAVVLVMNEKGANITTHYTYSDQGVTATGQYQNMEGELQLGITIGLGIPEGGPEVINALLQRLVGCITGNTSEPEESDTTPAVHRIRRWSEDEDQILLEVLSKSSTVTLEEIRELAACVERTCSAVKQRLIKLRHVTIGPRTTVAWSMESDDLLRQYIAEESPYTIEELARVLERTPNAVSTRISRMRVDSKDQ